MKICIIGSGSWGTAIAYLLAKNGHTVTMWTRSAEKARQMETERENKDYIPGVKMPDNVSVCSDFEKAAQGTDMFIMSKGSKYVRETAEMYGSLIPTGALVVNASKGLEDGTLLRMSQILTETLPEREIAVISGPSHAEEVVKEIPTAVVASAINEKSALIIQDTFMNRNFRVYTNNDIIGVELGGALKNVIALAAGISDGMGYGDNTKAALMTRGIREISRLGLALGANADTFNGLSGIGDLIVTCTSMHSRNRRCGILLGEGMPITEALATVRMEVEGVNTSRAAYNMAVKHNVESPIITEIYNILDNGKDPRQAVSDLMTRDRKTENNMYVCAY
ncbi:MAG: NAD(P)H-dependent glycerol-3-phosphate dehydrogenase [Clostridiales bacterium]|jgi:glycerol-3-phosphate dehydrogenase (NAD(P)+)|nr:NAD(P)H-dependent glycerol-3-phosphate dehydrogenase [Clostridiales bacterium]